jgi:chemotaxis protein CheC
MSDPPLLDELERDALTELVNIGVSRAAASLRKMVGAQVLLSVPAVEVVSRRAAATLLGERESETLVAVRQAFEGAFSGHAMLIFPEANSREIARAVSGGDLRPEELADLETEVLAETGNVILNGCLAAIANMLHRPLSLSLPEVLRGDGADLFHVSEGVGADSLVLFLYIDFTVRARDIHGYIAMLMDLPALVVLRGLIKDFIAQAIGEDEAQAHGG